MFVAICRDLDTRHQYCTSGLSDGVARGVVRFSEVLFQHAAQTLARLGALGDVISHQPFDRFELEGASALLSGEPV
jgi:hypothetical protein